MREWFSISTEVKWTEFLDPKQREWSSSDVASVRLVCVQSVANSNFFDSQDREDPTFPNHKGIGTNSPWVKISSKMSYERSKQHGFCTWFETTLGQNPIFYPKIPWNFMFEKCDFENVNFVKDEISKM